MKGNGPARDSETVPKAGFSSEKPWKNGHSTPLSEQTLSALCYFSFSVLHSSFSLLLSSLCLCVSVVRIQSTHDARLGVELDIALALQVGDDAQRAIQLAGLGRPQRHSQ